MERARLLVQNLTPDEEHNFLHGTNRHGRTSTDERAGRSAEIYIKTRAEGERGLQELLRASVDINTPGQEGYTALHSAAAYGDNLQVATLLVANKADLDLKDDRGDTALQVAAAYGNLQEATLLVANKADLDLKDKDGDTALDLAEQFELRSAQDGDTALAFLREQRRVAQANKEQEAPRAVVALDADIQRISRLKQAEKWFQEHGVIEFFDDAVKQLGLTGPGDIEFFERADLEAIGMPALKVRRVLQMANKAKSG